MIHYIIQTIAFQLLFLVVYDLFLKKETFFNLNRAYLLMTPVLSFVLPFIKIETLKEAVPGNYVFYLPEVIVENTVNISDKSWLSSFTTLQWIIITGILFSLVLFIIKLTKIYKLKRWGEIKKHRYFTEVVINHSSVAFSFFRNIFLGDEVLKREHKHIIEHELVHINHKHSWDLAFFELLRIIFWFNPLVYIYQNRIAELHEFIADTHTVKTNKKEHYQHLLEEVFKTEKISFINQFFNHSLIKKRIVMLQKSKSKKVWKLKYLLMLPLVILMLFYTSCEKNSENWEANPEKFSKNEVLHVKDLNNLSNDELKQRDKHLENFEKTNELSVLTMHDDEGNSVEMYVENGKFRINVIKESSNKAKAILKDVKNSFSSIKVKPSFKEPCEVDGMDHSECFKQKLDEHIMKNFRYPEEAIEKKIEGRVYIQFKINTDGTVKVINSRAPHPVLDEEGIRLIESLPELNPGTDENGNIVPVTFAYPIVFKLN